MIINEYNSRPTSTWPPLVSWKAAGWNASGPCNRTRARTVTRFPTASWRPARRGKWSGPRRNTYLQTLSATLCTSGSSCAGVVDTGLTVKWFGSAYQREHQLLSLSRLRYQRFQKVFRTKYWIHVHHESKINFGYADTAKAYYGR